MKKTVEKLLVFLLTLIALAFGGVLCAEAAVITSEARDEINKIYNVTIAPGGQKTAHREIDSDSVVIKHIFEQNRDCQVNLTLTPGEYHLYHAIHVFGNETINAEGSTVIQDVAGKGLIISAYYKGSQYGESAGGFNGVKNVTINGGTWVGSANPDTSKAKKSNGYYVGYSSFLFMHSSNITINGCAFKNNYNGHFIEIAGVKNANIINCNLAVSKSVYTGEPSNEAIQIDNTYRVENSPVGTPWDDTACENVTIKDCKIKYGRGIGTNRIGNKFFKNIRIENCNITATKQEGINAYDVLGLTIKNCRVKSKGKKDNYTSCGIYIGLDSKVKSWKGYKTVIQGTTATGFHAGMKICVPKNNTKFGTVQISKCTFASGKSKSRALYITNKGKQIKKLSKSKITVKKVK